MVRVNNEVEVSCGPTSLETLVQNYHKFIKLNSWVAGLKKKKNIYRLN